MVVNKVNSLAQVEGIQPEIQRLQRRAIVELEQVEKLHQWLESKRLSRSACRIVGESRTGKTVACELYYSYLHPPQQISGETPKVPVAYILPPQECGPKELFANILEYLKYQMKKSVWSIDKTPQSGDPTLVVSSSSLSRRKLWSLSGTLSTRQPAQ